MATSWEMDSMAFAFYISRHGARVPLAYEYDVVQADLPPHIFDEDIKLFNAAPGDLTV